MTFTILCWQAEGTATTTDSASRGLKVAAEEKVAFSQHGGVNRLTWRPASEFQKAWDLAPAQVITDVNHLKINDGQLVRILAEGNIAIFMKADC